MSSPRELLEPYLAERAIFVSESTARATFFHLKRFFEFLDSKKVKAIGEISFELLNEYRHRLETVPGSRGKMASGFYLHQSLHSPRLFLIWAYREGHILEDFTSYPMPHYVYPEVVVPSVEQVKILMEAPDIATAPGLRDRLVMESFYTLGLRRRESHRLSISDLDLSQQTVKVMGKRRRERLLPLSGRLCELLQSYLKKARLTLRPYPDEDALWISPQTGTRLSFTYLREIVKRYTKLKGLSDIYPHLLRHACATHMLEAGADIEQIQLYLGHLRPDSTRLYTHVSCQEMKTVFDRTHPRATL